MKEPIVSYVMPTIRDKYLAETIKSVFDQTLDAWEFIIIDPLNRDLPSKFPELKDDRVRIYVKDLQPNIAYNFGRYHAKSDCILHISDDDIDLPTRAEVCYQGLNKPGSYRPVDIFIASYYRINEQGEITKTEFVEDFRYESFKYWHTDMPLMSGAFRKSTTPMFDPQFFMMADIAWFMECHNKNLRIVTSKEITAKVRDHADRICVNGNSIIRHARRCEANRLAAYFNDPSIADFKGDYAQ